MGKYDPAFVGATFLDNAEIIRPFHGDGSAIGVVIFPEVGYGDDRVRNVVALVGLHDDHLTKSDLADFFEEAPPNHMDADAAHRLGTLLLKAAERVRAKERAPANGAARRKSTKAKPQERTNGG
jgi:hypothetical protein